LLEFQIQLFSRNRENDVMADKMLDTGLETGCAGNGLKAKNPPTRNPWISVRSVPSVFYFRLVMLICGNFSAVLLSPQMPPDFHRYY
jgi:hypothetical protein